MILSTAIYYQAGFYNMYENLSPIFFMGIVMISLPKEQKIVVVRYLIILMVIAFLYTLFSYSLSTFLNYNLIHRFDRNFNQYSVILFPFLFAYSIWDNGNLLLKLVISLFLTIPALIALLWTGERGAWGAVFVEVIMLLALSGNFRRLLNKKMLAVTSFSIVFLILIGFYFYQTNQIFKSQIQKGIGGSGRSVIISTRLPIFCLMATS